VVFRQYPAQSVLSYANALQDEGNFGEVTRGAWADGYQRWTGEFGQETFKSRTGDVRLEMDDEAVEAAAKEQNVRADDLRNSVDALQKMINYRYWRTRAKSESELNTEQAHREIYEGQQLFKESKLREAKEKLLSGLTKFEEVLKNYPTIGSEDDAIDEIQPLGYWRYILRFGRISAARLPPPQDLGHPAGASLSWTACSSGITASESLSRPGILRQVPLPASCLALNRTPTVATVSDRHVAIVTGDV
jgi:hypothetical protein